MLCAVSGASSSQAGACADRRDSGEGGIPVHLGNKAWELVLYIPRGQTRPGIFRLWRGSHPPPLLQLVLCFRDEAVMLAGWSFPSFAVAGCKPPHTAAFSRSPNCMYSWCACVCLARMIFRPLS